MREDGKVIYGKFYKTLSVLRKNVFKEKIKNKSESEMNRKAYITLFLFLQKRKPVLKEKNSGGKKEERR